MKPRMNRADVDELDAIIASHTVPIAPEKHITAMMAAAKWGVDRQTASDRLNADHRLTSALCRTPGTRQRVRCWWVKPPGPKIAASIRI